MTVMAMIAVIVTIYGCLNGVVPVLYVSVCVFRCLLACYMIMCHVSRVVMSCAPQYHGLFGLVLCLLFPVAMEVGRSVGQLTGWTACRFVGCLCCFRENRT